MQHFTARDYRGDAVCVTATQDARGVLYVANGSLVLEYDGTTWRKVPMGAINRVAALAYDAATDRVFVGSLTDLGYLAAKPGGERTFVSLLDQLPADQRAVGQILAVYATPAGVFFVSADHVLRWRDGHLRVWPLAAGSARVRSGWAAGHLYVQNPDLGLQRLEGDTLVSASDDPLFHRVTVTALADNPDGTVLVGTAHDGLFTLRTDGAAAPCTFALNGWLKEQGVLRLLRLHDGSLAVVTDVAGLLLLDQEGRFRNHLDHAGGLRGNNLYGLHEDAEGGLWVGLDAGITRAEIASPVLVLRAGPEDDVSNVTTGNDCAGTLLLANAAGMYRLVPADPAAATPAHLDRVPGLDGMFTSSATVANGLLVTSRGRIDLIDADLRRVPVLTTSSQRQVLRLSRRHPGLVYYVEETGHIGTLRLDERSGCWTADATVAELGGPLVVAGLAETDDGALWIGSFDRGLFRVQPGADGQAPRITSFLDAPGLLHGRRYVYANGGDGSPLLLVTEDKLYRPDESGQNVRLATEYGSRFVDGSFACQSLLGYGADALWILGKPTNDPLGETLRARVSAAPDGRAPAPHELPRGIDDAIGQLQGFIPLENPPTPLQTLLVLGSVGNGVVRLDVSRWEAGASPRPFATLLRRAVTTGGGADGGEPQPILGEALPFTRNSAHFEYAAGTLAFGAAPPVPDAARRL